MPEPEFGIDALRSRRCECGAASCTAVVQITWAEQNEADHADSVLWIVASGHEPKEARVVRRTERFVVVEVEEDGSGEWSVRDRTGDLRLAKPRPQPEQTRARGGNR